VSVVLVASAALAAPAGAKPHVGKVVRVERQSRAIGGVPRYCLLQADALRHVSGNCMGQPPAVGDAVTVLDDQRVIGVVRLTTIVPSTDSTCVDPLSWVVTGVPIGGQPAFSTATGIIDVPLDFRTARLVQEDHPPIGRSGGVEAGVIAIDDNGDGAPDIELVSYFCDDGGAPIAGTGPNTCMDAWMLSGHGFERVRQDKFKTCW
jgi:hypothetical protein